MKNTFRIAAPGLVCIFAAASCGKKSGNSGSSNTPPTCQLTSINLRFTGAEPETYNITYNDAGQVSTVDFLDSGFATVKKAYTYSGNTLYMSETSGGKACS